MVHSSLKNCEPASVLFVTMLHGRLSTLPRRALSCQRNVSLEVVVAFSTQGDFQLSIARTLWIPAALTLVFPKRASACHAGTPKMASSIDAFRSLPSGSGYLVWKVSWWPLMAEWEWYATLVNTDFSPQVLIILLVCNFSWIEIIGFLLKTIRKPKPLAQIGWYESKQSRPTNKTSAHL